MDITKRLRKIEKSEEKALKILCKQRKDLIKALEDTDKLIIKKIDKGTPEEAKLEAEIEKLAQVSTTMCNFTMLGTRGLSHMPSYLRGTRSYFMIE